MAPDRSAYQPRARPSGFHRPGGRRRSLIAPTEIKAVLRVRTLVAMDTDWHVGRGPELLGTAEAHLLFLFSRPAQARSL